MPEDGNNSSKNNKRPAASPPKGEFESKKMTDRTRRNSNSASNLETLMLEIESRQNARLDELFTKLKTNTEEIQDVKTLITSREESVLREVRERDAVTNARIDGLAASITANSRKARQTDAYHEHRRALRLWPVIGRDATGKEMRIALCSFLREHLKLTGDEVLKLGSISIKRHRDPTAKTPDEVLCIFETRASRDLIKAAGKHLAGNNSAGMRIHVPAHLEANFKVLQSLGYHLRQSDESIRRSIKFDDVHEDLIMDVKVDGVWSRITPDEARKVCEETPEVYSGPRSLSAEKITGILKKKKKSPATGANATPTPTQ